MSFDYEKYREISYATYKKHNAVAELEFARFLEFITKKIDERLESFLLAHPDKFSFCSIFEDTGILFLDETLEINFRRKYHYKRLYYVLKDIAKKIFVEDYYIITFLENEKSILRGKEYQMYEIIVHLK